MTVFPGVFEERRLRSIGELLGKDAELGSAHHSEEYPWLHQEEELPGLQAEDCHCPVSYQGTPGQVRLLCTIPAPCTYRMYHCIVSSDTHRQEENGPFHQWLYTLGLIPVAQ